jgi:hypothetical protein
MRFHPAGSKAEAPRARSQHECQPGLIHILLEDNGVDTLHNRVPTIHNESTRR